MNLVEICEPLFQYVCRLNRLARKGGRADFGVVRGEVKGLLAEMRAKAEQTPAMIGAYNQIELVLIFFVDSMILNSNLGGGWKPLSGERGELAFEEKFWDLLEDALRDPSDTATQRLAVFYVCIGLGFTGLYTGQPDYIRRKMLEISARLRGMIDANQAARICNDAYDGVDTRNLTQPPNRSLTGVVIALVALTVVLLVAYVQLFRYAGQQLDASFTNIQKSHNESGKPSA
ncbi:MAG TPA: DotU family type IV/VI secretion system protein [Phycisphaerales bacterium]|nr:DotU family type IV/VI secretion system protein [Phycisphaerales bacterium]